MSQPWMAFYVADYLADTRRLSTLEHGAYLLLIFDYWRNGGLPNDDKKLARIAGLSCAKWKSVRTNVAELFQEGWKHKRIDSELAKSVDKSGAARASAAKRWDKEREAEEDANAMRSHNERNADEHANAMLSQPQSQSQPEKKEPSAGALGREVATKPKKRTRIRCAIEEDAKPSAADAKAAIDRGLSAGDLVVQWRKFRDYHISRGSMMADWPAAWRTWLGNINEYSPAGHRHGTPEKRTVHDAARDLAEMARSTTVIVPPIPPAYSSRRIAAERAREQPLQLFDRDGEGEGPVRRLSQG